MAREKVKVIYHGKEVAIQDLILNRVISKGALYYQYRLGKSPQEAVDLLTSLVEVPVIYEGKEYLLANLFFELPLSHHVYYGCLSRGMSYQEAFEACLHFEPSSKEVLEEAKKNGVSALSIKQNLHLTDGCLESAVLQSLKNQQIYRNRKEMSKQFQIPGDVSLDVYCREHLLNYREMLELLQSGKSLGEAERIYQNKEDRNLARYHYVFWGVSLKAICIKFQLNYDRCVKQLRSGKSFEEAIDISLMNSVGLSIQEVNFLKSIWSVLLNATYDDLEMLRDLYSISDSLFEKIQEIKQRKTWMDHEFYFYSLRFLFESRMESIYQNLLLSISQDIQNKEVCQKYYQQCRAQLIEEFFAQYHLSEEDLSYMFGEMFQDFEHVQTKTKDVWVYKKSRKKENM